MYKNNDFIKLLDKMKIVFFILLLLYLMIFSSCSYNKKNNYIQDGSSFILINSQKQCKTSLELDKNHKLIRTIYSSCNVMPSVTERVDDIEKIIKHFKLMNKFKKSNIIKITFLKDGIAFPNLLKYINKDKRWNNKIFSYNEMSNLQNISKNFYRKISLYINNSNIYNVKKMTLAGCSLKLYPKYYLEDKTLYTIPKIYDYQLLLNADLFNIGKDNDKKFPALDYMPFIVSCEL